VKSRGGRHHHSQQSCAFLSQGTEIRGFSFHAAFIIKGVFSAALKADVGGQACA